MTPARTIHDVQQGSGPWLALRRAHFTASEAPAMMGASRYQTRAALLRQHYTGAPPEHDPATLARFAAGHAAEAAARPLAEAIVGDLYPITATVEVDGLRLLASLDGITLDEGAIWETKIWNEELVESLRRGDVPEHYRWQVDQQLLVTGAARCLFSCTDGTPERFVSCWYEADESRFGALLDGWRQFAADLAGYVLPESPDPAPVGRAPESLPALRIEVTGAVAASNLAEFKEVALAAIRSVNRELSTDQHFADAERAVKWCADVEARLKAAKEHALSQTADIDALFKALDDIGAEARAVRLDLDKLVTRRKTEVKEEAVAKARAALDAHIATLNAELAPMRVPQPAADFAGAIKGLKSLASMQDKLDGVLAVAKIAAEADARGIRANVAAFQQHATGFEFLFSDLGQVVHKAADDFLALVTSRIATHKAAEAERERKRQEAEQVRQAEAARLAAEAAARAAQQQAAAPAPAPMAAQPSTPVAAPAAAPAPAPRADEPATLKLGTICERLGFTMTAAFVFDTLGIKPAKSEGAAKLYRESDFGRICAALQQHIERVYAAQREEVAA